MVEVSMRPSLRLWAGYVIEELRPQARPPMVTRCTAMRGMPAPLQAACHVIVRSTCGTTTAHQLPRNHPLRRTASPMDQHNAPAMHPAWNDELPACPRRAQCKG
jgi:hypothetical protein